MTDLAHEAIDIAQEMGAEPDAVAEHLAMLPSRYADALDARTIVRHVLMIDSLTDPTGPARSAMTSRVSPKDGDGLDVLDVVARPRGGLLRQVTGALAIAGGSVVSAQAFTRRDGVAVDHFTVQTPIDVSLSWWAGVEGDIADAGDSRLAVRARVERVAAEARVDLNDPDARVTVASADDAEHSVVRLRVPDRPGLLFLVAAALTELGVELIDARVSTSGKTADDRLLVNTRNAETGELQDLDDHHRAELELALRHALQVRDKVAES